MIRPVLWIIIGAASIGGANAVHAGPCMAQIAAIELQIKRTPPGPQTGPTAPQSVDAQLHHQPTPGDVSHAEHIANKDADGALERARTADIAGDAAGCNAAVDEAKRLYDVDQ
jgi:hypothetical protein